MLSEKIKNKKEVWLNYLKRVGKFISRWLYLAMLLLVTMYAVFVWHKYIVKSEWSEEKKREYINQQAAFSFDRKDYQKAVDFINNRKERLESGEVYTGRDVFFPEE